MVKVIDDWIYRSVELGSYRLNPSTAIQSTNGLEPYLVDKDRLDPQMDTESLIEQ
jgi:hypothetical protein